MDRDLISLALQELALKEGTGLKDVQQYLRMKYRLEAEERVLQRRLAKLLQTEKAVA